MESAELFNETLHVVNRLVMQGARDDALVVLRLLTDNPAFGLSRVIACVNCAIVYEQKGDGTAALGWYDRAIEMEEETDSCVGARFKAALLGNSGRKDEGMELCYEHLQRRLKPDEEAALRKTLAALEAAP